MTELDNFLNKLIPALKKELGPERALEFLLSICPPERYSQAEVREIRERLSLQEYGMKQEFIRVPPLEILQKAETIGLRSTLGFFYSPYKRSGRFVTREQVIR